MVTETSRSARLEPRRSPRQSYANNRSFPAHFLLHYDKEHFPGSTVDATMNIVSGQGKFVVWSADNLRDWTQNDQFSAMGAGMQVRIRDTTKHKIDPNEPRGSKNPDHYIGTSTHT